MSVDETDARLARLDWSRERRLALVRRGLHRNRRARAVHVSERASSFFLGSEDDAIRAQGLEIMRKRFGLRGHSVGIRVIQLAGYDILSAGQ